MSGALKPESPDNEYIHAPPPARRDARSSTSVPRYDENDLNLIPSSEREIDVYRDGQNGNLQLLLSGDVSSLYFVRSSLFRPGIPDVTIFAGSDKNGAVIGVCNYAAFSTSIKVGRGDPANPNNVEWEEVSKASRDHSVYKFSIWSREEQRKSYSWKRTHDPNIKGTKSSKLDRRSWKLEDDATGQVVAVFASTGIKSWKKAGKFRLLATEGKEWEEWVVLTCLGLYEKARRRAIARRDLTWFV
jgi:hypothetical protein